MIDKKTLQKQGIKMIEGSQKQIGLKNEKIAALKNLIPEVVNSDGQVDVAAIQDFFGTENTTTRNKGYELTFAGKGLARAKADSETELELQTEKAQSKNFDTTQNTVIRGDNLEVLKILKQNYFEKIKMIYIDPPYNTKSENFIYSDNFKQSDEELIENLDLDEDTIEFLHNVYGTRSHSGWLAFMYPRLKLARDLLKEDGVIFISIDDNEQANLKIMCDEIFGEENFVNSFVWVSNLKGRQISNSGACATKEFCLCYAKNIDLVKTFEAKIQDVKRDMPSVYKGFNYEVKTDDIGRYVTKNELYNTNSGFNELTRPNLVFDIFYNPVSKQVKFEGEAENGFVHISPKKIPDTDHFYAWRWSKNKIKTETHNLDFICTPQGIWKIYTNIRYFSSTIFKDIILDINTSQGNDDLKKLSLHKYFDYPKPVKLLHHLLSVATEPGDLILDFFAGSGTTGDAVMQLNNADSGDRKFILVQWDEEIKESQEAYKFCKENNLIPVISSITIERLNRAGEKIKVETKKDLDTGYKVFSLTPKPTVLEKVGVFAVAYKRNNSTDTLMNMLCATGKPLHTKVGELIKGKLYKVDEELYLLGDIQKEDLQNHRNRMIYIDGWSDISLEYWLNLDVVNKDNLQVVY